jgi:hypothetical protein
MLCLFLNTSFEAKRMMNKVIKVIFSMILVAMVSSCGGIEASYPKSEQERREERYGKLTGEGIILFGDKKKGEDLGITVNSYLWRSSLDVLSFMPLATVDPFGGLTLVA